MKKIIPILLALTILLVGCSQVVFDSGIRGETYIALNEIQNVYEAKE